MPSAGRAGPKRLMPSSPYSLCRPSIRLVDLGDPVELERRREESRSAAFEALHRFIHASGGVSSMLDGWTTSAEVRRAGDSAGHVDVYFHAPDGRRFRSRLEVARFFELAPHAEQPAWDSRPVGSRSGRRNGDARPKRQLDADAVV